MWHGLSIIFNEVFLSNKFSFEPQHYLEDSYIPIFALIYSLKLLGLQVLKCSLAKVLLMTFFITEIIEGIVSAILITYNV